MKKLPLLIPHITLACALSLSCSNLVFAQLAPTSALTTPGEAKQNIAPRRPHLVTRERAEEIIRHFYISFYGNSAAKPENQPFIQGLMNSNLQDLARLPYVDPNPNEKGEQVNLQSPLVTVMGILQQGREASPIRDLAGHMGLNPDENLGLDNDLNSIPGFGSSLTSPGGGQGLGDTGGLGFAGLGGGPRSLLRSLFGNVFGGQGSGVMGPGGIFGGMNGALGSINGQGGGAIGAMGGPAGVAPGRGTGVIPAQIGAGELINAAGAGTLGQVGSTPGGRAGTLFDAAGSGINIREKATDRANEDLGAAAVEREGDHREHHHHHRHHREAPPREAAPRVDPDARARADADAAMRDAVRQTNEAIVREQQRAASLSGGTAAPPWAQAPAPPPPPPPTPPPSGTNLPGPDDKGGKGNYISGNDGKGGDGAAAPKEGHGGVFIVPTRGPIPGLAPQGTFLPDHEGQGGGEATAPKAALPSASFMGGMMNFLGFGQTQQVEKNSKK